MLCSRKMFNLFVSKNVRKILKRKDSDAGEKGKALEDLRSSLFNELRSSEGARRYQQRLCGPMVALTFNFLVSVGIILMNKLVLGKVGFNYPIFLTFIHYVVSWFLMAILNALSMLPAPPAKASRLSSLFALGVVMSLSTGLANVSLKYNSVGFYQMAKIAVTPSIVVAEFILLRKKFHLFGACIALAWIVPSAVNKIMWSSMQQRENWTALALMWKTTPITVFFLVVMMPWLDPPGILSFKWDFGNTSIILMSALLGFLLQWSGALALGATSAITHVVLGQFKTCVILIGGYLLFGSNPGITSICGAITALMGMSVYTYLNLNNSEQHSNKTVSKQASFSSPKSKLSRENGDAHIGNDAAESV
uniref:Sugar phosphate transporter domain-containing protein n=1 Tax=Chenopodium quinoa TaxID=63459 RepID=A0A803MKC5_CHEQI